MLVAWDPTRLTIDVQHAVHYAKKADINGFGRHSEQVNIGWKSFVIDEAFSTEGCLDGWEGVTDIGSPFGDGIYKKKSVSGRQPSETKLKKFMYA